MAGQQIPTSVTIISSLKGFSSVSIDAMTTMSLPTVLAGGVLEVAGAFFQWPTNETPNASSWTAIATGSTAYIVCTPSGSAGNQIITTSYISSAVWVDSKGGYYASAGSSARVIGNLYKASTSGATDKALYFGLKPWTEGRTELGPLVLTGINTRGIGRPDSQIELINAATGHAMISTVALNTPPSTVNEHAWSGASYTTASGLTQIGAFYMRWENADASTGYSVIGMHPNYNGGQASDRCFEAYGNHGIVMFPSVGNTPPASRYLQIRRTTGVPSIAGTQDIVIDANSGGSVQDVFLNAYNTGDVRLAAGGGNVGIGASVATITDKLDIDGTMIRLRGSHSVASGETVGHTGEICWDSNYLYVCIADTPSANWRRVALVNF